MRIIKGHRPMAALGLRAVVQPTGCCAAVHGASFRSTADLPIASVSVRAAGTNPSVFELSAILFEKSNAYRVDSVGKNEDIHPPYNPFWIFAETVTVRAFQQKWSIC